MAGIGAATGDEPKIYLAMISFLQRGMLKMERKNYSERISWLLPITMALFAVLSIVAVHPVAGVTMAQKSFATPLQAVDDLITAVQSDNVAELLNIFGPESEDLIASGDEVADRNGRNRFVKACEKKLSLEQENEDRVLLSVGSSDYPFPIPLVRNENTWFFDTQAGMEEILNRRIGRNELNTTMVMQAYTDAQREYATMNHNGGSGEFAQKITSSTGKKDGLYWEKEDNGPESPFGPLIARAVEEGYEGAMDMDPPEPFHGYFFKILKKQGEHADGGAYDYVVNGKMLLGFGLVAYPAKYGASGIMTFIVNQKGVIYEKDMGEDTETAAAMTTFDPDDTWHKYEEPGGNQ